MDRAGGGDPSLHGFHEPLGDGQAQTRALGAVGRFLHAPELVEHPFQLDGGYASPLVLDGDDDRSPILIGGEFDRRAVGAVGDSVLQDIDDRLLQQAGVCRDQTEAGRKVANDPPRALACPQRVIRFRC